MIAPCRKVATVRRIRTIPANDREEETRAEESDEATDTSQSSARACDRGRVASTGTPDFLAPDGREHRAHAQRPRKRKSCPRCVGAAWAFR